MSEKDTIEVTPAGFEKDPSEVTQQRDAALRLVDRLEQALSQYERESAAIPPGDPVRVGEIQLPRGRDIATHLALDLTVELDQIPDLIAEIRKTATQPSSQLECHAIEWHRDDLEHAATGH